MPDNLVIYDVLYQLAAADGREEALFGSCAPLAREAFAHSLIGNIFPIVWYELPLLGMPRFDLHVAHSRQALRPGTTFSPGAGFGHDELFRWYAEDETGGNGLAFAFDVSDRGVDSPAIHVNVNNSPLAEMDRFFDLTGGKGAANLYRGFSESLPEGWRVWYAGVHPGRPGSPVRVDCFVDGKLQNDYAQDVSLLEKDLLACGFTATSQAIRDLVTPILESPFGLELQFDVTRDGSLGPTLGLSAGFGRMGAATLRPLFEEGGAIATLMGKAEALGLSDDRWHRVADAMFGRLFPMGGKPTVLYCTPTFVKLRMREGTPLDAKFYLQAGVIEAEASPR